MLMLLFSFRDILNAIKPETKATTIGNIAIVPNGNIDNVSPSKAVIILIIISGSLIVLMF